MLKQPSLSGRRHRGSGRNNKRRRGASVAIALAPNLLEQLTELRGAILGHKVQTALLTIAGMFFTWIVLAKSLPFALAERAPGVALWLDPGNPAALIARAEQSRGALSNLTKSRQAPEAAPMTITAGGVPAMAFSAADESEARIAEIRGEIASLARQAIAHEPLNARAYRLLAEVSETPDQTRRFMNAAIMRSRREAGAVYWVMNDSLDRRDFADAVQKADILLRMGSQFNADVLGHLATIAASPDGREALVPALAQNPRWRMGFFVALAKKVQLADTPFEVMAALRQAGSPATTPEIAPYLRILAREGLAPYAYEVWRDLLPAKDGQTPALLNNADFKDEPSGLPFDWIMERGGNTIVEFTPLGTAAEGRAIGFNFGIGRVQFPELSQVLVLAPGRYRFTGEMQGLLRGARGLRWALRCDNGPELAKTEMLYGDPRGAARGFSLDIEISGGKDCSSQRLRLFHDARSSSEQFLSGHAVFQQLSLAPL